MDIDGTNVYVTAGFGVTGVDPETLRKNIHPDAMIALADKRLYQAKNE